MARCPAHDDRRESQSIAEGRDRRVITFCFAGCSLSNILKAMGLRLRDLFSTERPSPEQRRAIEAQRQRERVAGRRTGEAAADARRLEDYVNLLGAELATFADDDQRGPEVTRRFHDACNAAHIAQEQWEQMRTGRAANATR
jgi:hypothetical protein